MTSNTFNVSYLKVLLAFFTENIVWMQTGFGKEIGIVDYYIMGWCLHQILSLRTEEEKGDNMVRQTISQELKPFG